MPGLDSIDMENIVPEAEQGHGCIVQKALAELSFDERAAALREIADRNSLRVDLAKTQVRLGSLDTKTTVGTAERFITLYIDAGGRAYNQKLMLKDILKNADGKHLGDCTDVKP